MKHVAVSAAHLFVIAPCLPGSTAEAVAGIAAAVGVTAAGALHVTASPGACLAVWCYSLTYCLIAYVLSDNGANVVEAIATRCQTAVGRTEIHPR